MGDRSRLEKELENLIERHTEKRRDWEIASDIADRMQEELDYIDDKIDEIEERLNRL